MASCVKEITLCLGLLTLLFLSSADVQGPTRLPTQCEVCKILTSELRARLDKSGKSKERMPIGPGIDPAKKKQIKYETSELRLIEAINEPHICQEIKKYSVHAERWGSNRYAKGASETMQTLQGLVNKGVKVTMDVPYDLWNETNAEVADMERKCYKLVEDYEEDIEDWYYHHQSMDIGQFLCVDKVLAKGDTGCLAEEWDGVTVFDKEKAEKASAEKKKKKKKKENKTTDEKKKSQKKKKGKEGKLKGDTGKKVEL